MGRLIFVDCSYPNGGIIIVVTPAGEPWQTVTTKEVVKLHNADVCWWWSSCVTALTLMFVDYGQAVQHWYLLMTVTLCNADVCWQWLHQWEIHQRLSWPKKMVKLCNTVWWSVKLCNSDVRWQWSHQGESHKRLSSLKKMIKLCNSDACWWQSSNIALRFVDSDQVM